MLFGHGGSCVDLDVIPPSERAQQLNNLVDVKKNEYTKLFKKVPRGKYASQLWWLQDNIDAYLSKELNKRTAKRSPLKSAVPARKKSKTGFHVASSSAEVHKEYDQKQVASAEVQQVTSSSEVQNTTPASAEVHNNPPAEVQNNSLSASSSADVQNSNNSPALSAEAHTPEIQKNTFDVYMEIFEKYGLQGVRLHASNQLKEHVKDLNAGVSEDDDMSYIKSSVPEFRIDAVYSLPDGMEELVVDKMTEQVIKDYNHKVIQKYLKENN